MAKPNNGLITETNAQYYSGSQKFVPNGVNKSYTKKIKTDLFFYK